MASRTEFKRDLSEPLVAGHYHAIEVKTPLIDKEDQIALLREKRNEILRCISLIKSGIRKRNRPIQLLMLLSMLGMAVYLIDNRIKYNEFKNQQDDDYFHLFPPLKEEFERLSNQSRYLHNEYNKAFSINKNFLDWLDRNHIRFTCIFPDMQYTTEYSCSAIMYDYMGGFCGQQTINTKLLCGYGWEKAKVTNIINPCPTHIDLYCDSKKVYQSIESEMLTLDHSIRLLLNQMNKLIPNYDLFYQSIGGVAVYYFLTCGLGEVAPLAVITLTLLTHMFTNCLTSSPWFNLSDEDAGEVLNTADKYEIEGDLSSYAKMLKNFQNELPIIDQQLERAESRLTFCMAQKEVDSKKTPLSLMFNDQKLREPRLARIIFEMAGITEESHEEFQIMNSSKDTRQVMEMGSHTRNAQPSGERLNPLFSFFDRLRNQTSNVEEYEYKQGKNSPKQVLRNIYEFAGFIPVAKKMRA